MSLPSPFSRHRNGPDRLVPVFLLLVWPVVAIGGEVTADLARVYDFRDLAECLEEFKDREFFESIYRYVHIEKTANHKFMLGVMFEHGIGVEPDAAKAARWYGEAEAAGYSFPELGREAERRLGELTASGAYDPRRPPGAAELTPLEKAAIEAGPKGMFDMSVRYFLGLCAPLDFEKSKEWEEKAAAGGLPEAARAVGLGYLTGEYAYPLAVDVARTYLEPLAEAGDAAALRLLGRAAPASGGERVVRTLDEYMDEIFEDGMNSYEKGFFLHAGQRFSEAGAFGIARAENYYLLGLIQEEGRCGDRDDYGAAKNYRLAAGLGKADAMLRLGVMHEEGRGVRRSAAEAKKWYGLAAAAGVVEARPRLERLEKDSTAKRPAEWETSPAFKKMIADAQYRASYKFTVYRFPEEMATAMAWLKKAAANGSLEATEDLRRGGRF